jgi:hypothetical protein
LIRKAVGGQRLALFRCTFSYKYATEKAWMRWVMFTMKTIRAEYTKATKINVQGINHYQDGTGNLE